MRHWRLWIMGVLLAGTASAVHAQLMSEFAIHPSAPRPFELVTLRYKALLCLGMKAGVARVGSDFVVTMYLNNNDGFVTCLPSLWRSYEEVRIGAFPPGTYAVNVVNRDNVYLAQPQRFEFNVEAPPGPPPAFRPTTDFSGHWWNPSQSGWGLSIHQSVADPMMVFIYHYDASGRPIWYVAPGGKWLADTVWEGDLYRTNTPPQYLSPFDPSRVDRAVVGRARLSFSPHVDAGDAPIVDDEIARAPQSARLEYEIDGVKSGAIIEKMRF